MCSGSAPFLPKGLKIRHSSSVQNFIEHPARVTVWIVNGFAFVVENHHCAL
jgi:hypothetical protein